MKTQSSTETLFGSNDTNTENARTKKLDKNEYSKLETDKKKCGWKTPLKWTAVASAIVGLIVGLVGLLVVLGQLQVGLAGVGAMSALTGLYVMLAGFGVALLATTLFTVACVVLRAKAKAGDAKPWCGNIKTNDKGQNAEVN